MATAHSEVAVPVGNAWTLLYTAAGAATVSVQSKSLDGGLLVRVGAAAAVGDAPGAAAEFVGPRAPATPLVLTAGDKVFARTDAPSAGVAVLRVQT